MHRIPTAYLSRQRRSPVRWLRLTMGAPFALWVLAVFAIEIARSVTHTDIPYTTPEFEFLFGLLYRVLPEMAVVLYVPFQLYWAGATASKAGSIFLARTGVSSDLLSITTVGMRRFVRSRFFFLCRAHWPYALLNAGVIWGLALYYGYENPRITYFYLSVHRPRIIVEVASVPFFPTVGQLLVPAAVALIASLGTLLLISACGVAASAMTAPRFRFAAGVVLRLLIWGAAFGLIMLNRIRQSFDVVGPVIGMFLDSGLSHTGGYLFAAYSSAQPDLPLTFQLLDQTGNLMTAPLYLIACGVLAAFILTFTGKMLQRR